MKKIFTLIAAALMAVSANAKTTLSWSFGDEPFSWNGKATFTTTGVSFPSAWDGVGFGISGYAPYTAGEYIVIKLSSITGSVKFYTQYGEWTSLANDAEVSADESSTIVGLEIGEAAAETMKQLCIQAKADNSSIDIAEIYVGTKAEYEADVEASKPETSALWEGTNDFGTAWDSSATFSVEASKFANAKEGDKLVFTFTCNTDDATYYQFKLCSNEDGWPVLTSNKDDLNDWNCATMSGAEATTYTVTLNAADITTLQTSGLRVCGYAITCTKVELQAGTTTAISTVKVNPTVDNGAYYNLSGQKVEKPSKGIYIHNGKKVVVK